MKKTALVLAAVALVAGLFTGCEKKSTVKNTDKVFVLGLDDAFPPLGFRNEDNQIVGYDIDLAKEVAKRLDMEFVAQPIDWALKEQELNTGKIDCIWNGLTITDERVEAMAFTTPYLANAQVVVVKADSGIKTLADMAGKVCGVQAGSSAQDAIEADPEFKSSLANIVEFAENITALNDLEIGQVDGVVMDLIVANYTIAQKNKNYVVLEESLAPESYGVAFKKDNTQLRDKVQETLESMVADGTMAQISSSWFGSDISVFGK